MPFCHKCRMSEFDDQGNCENCPDVVDIASESAQVSERELRTDYHPPRLEKDGPPQGELFR